MTIEVYLQSSETGKVFDISTLCGTITYDSYLRGQPGKCSLTIQKDPNGILQITSGSIVSVKVDGEGIFFGYVFTHGTDATETYKITCYDQMRYLKNPEIYVTEAMTSAQIFSLICSQTSPALKHKVKFDSGFIVPAYRHIDKSRYAIIEYGLDQTLAGTHALNKPVLCFVRDDYGILIHSELEIEKTNLVIGDSSLLTSYKYEISIDKSTANEVKVYRDDEDTGLRAVYIAKDSDNQKRWGIIRHLQEAGKELNEAQIRELAYNLLRQKNHETKTMTLSALGYPSLRAGSGFILNIPRLNILEWMWIDSVTHTFKNDLHTMSMNVFVS